MMKKIRKGRLIVAVLLFISLSFAASFAVFTIINGPNTQYIYKGANGEEYLFDTFEESNLKIHVMRVFVGDRTVYYPLRYGPNQVKDIKLDTNARELITGYDTGIRKKVIYITQEPDLPDLTEGYSPLANVVINSVTGESLYGAYGVPTLAAVTRETPGSIANKLPIITCEDATADTAVILMTIGPQSRIYNKGDCTILEGADGLDLLKVASKLVMHLVGVF